MERLTWKSVIDGYEDVGLKDGVSAGDAILQLAAYEDTGLDPEEVKQVKLSLMGKALAEIKEFEGVQIARMIELAQAEKDGRLVVLPCKVGDTLWTNISIVGDRYKSADRPYPVEVVFIGMGKDDRFFHVQYESGTVFPFDYDKVGKNVFLTREEAEAALKKREDGENEAVR